MAKTSLQFFFIFLFLLHFSASLHAATAHDWLVSQQHSTTAILDSYEGDGSPVAYTYDQACAIVAFTCENDIINAKRLLDKMIALQNSDGSWYEAYRYDNGQVMDTYKYAGRTLWMAIAINYYTSRTGDTSYVNASKKACDWTLTLQDTSAASQTYGGIRGGYNNSGNLITWFSTEFNHDAYAALKKSGELLNNQLYTDRAQLIYNFIAAKLWDNTEGRFHTGFADTSKYLDPQSWSIPSIGLTGPQGQDFTRAIVWAYTNMSLTRDYNSKTIQGFDYDGYTSSPNGGIWFEGTEQMVLAYDVMGDLVSANYYHSQAAKAQAVNGGIICSTGDGSYSWPTNFPYNSVGATSWFIYGAQSPRVNPFKPPSDITPPLLTNIIASNISTTGTISWTTNENSDSQVEYGLTTAYGNLTQIDANAVQNHVRTLTKLTSSTTYYYRVRSKDAADNLAISSGFSLITPDTAAPEITNINSFVATTSATITWATNENSDSQVEYGLTPDYGKLSTLNTTPVVNHNIALTGLSSNTTYYFRVKSKDTTGNLANSANTSFITKIEGDITSPVITNVSTFEVVQTSATITWQTNESSDSLVQYGLTPSCEKSTTLDTTLQLNHSVKLTELSSNTTYYFRVISKDLANNEKTSDIYSFTTAHIIDTDIAIPLINEISSMAISSTTVTISWTTNENSDSQIKYGLSTWYTQVTQLNTSPVQNHTVTITELSSNTLYHYRVLSRDVAGNLAISEDYTFKTLPRTYIIKGFIKDPSGRGVPNVTVTLSGIKSAESATDLVGYYEFTGLFSGAYTLAIAKPGYISIASSKTFTTLESDQENQDFIIEQTYAIRGYIKAEDGSGMEGVIVSLQGDDSHTYSTNTNGYYEFTELLSGNYTINLSKEGVYFIPEQRVYIMFESDQDNQDFEALSYTVNTNAIIIGGKQGYINTNKGEKAQIVIKPADSGTVIVKVYDLPGNLVWETSKEIVANNIEIITWDGKNNNGETTASGVYLCFVEAPGIRAIKKIAVVK